MGAYCGTEDKAKIIAQANPRAEIIAPKEEKPAPLPEPKAKEEPPPRKTPKNSQRGGSSVREGKAKTKESSKNPSTLSVESAGTGSGVESQRSGSTTNQAKVTSALSSIVAVDEDDPVFDASQKAVKAYSFTDETHGIVAKVCDFVCGCPSPPAPEPVDYMVRTLAETMMQFQGQMSKELKAAGDETGEETLVKPEMAAMWEMERFYPSSENSDLRVLNLRFLAICRENGEACMAKMNVFCEGDRSSGFTLDSVSPVAGRYVSEELVELARERHQTRRMGLAFGSDLFEGDYDLRTPIHIAASEGDLEGCTFLIQMAKGDKSKISPRDRWGGTPLGDAERGLIKNSEEKDEKEETDEHGVATAAKEESGAAQDAEEGASLLQYAECVKLFKEHGADSDTRGVFDTIDIALNESPEAVEIIEAAASGDITEMRHFSSNPNLYTCDYDSRTALHLAASNGHLNIIKFLLKKMDSHDYIRRTKVKEEPGADKEVMALKLKAAKCKRKLGILHYQDRFYGTPMIDTQREGAVPGNNKARFDACYDELKRWDEKLNRELSQLMSSVTTLSTQISESRTNMEEEEEQEEAENGEEEAPGAVNPDAAAANPDAV